jgi:hypothetical protein
MMRRARLCSSRPHGHWWSSSSRPARRSWAYTRCALHGCGCTAVVDGCCQAHRFTMSACGMRNVKTYGCSCTAAAAERSKCVCHADCCGADQLCCRRQHCIYFVSYTAMCEPLACCSSTLLTSPRMLLLIVQEQCRCVECH